MEETRKYMRTLFFVLIVCCPLSMIAQSNTKRKIDTTYAYRTTRLKKVEVLETQTVQNDKFYLNSKTNAFVKGGKNRVLLPINLPENTVEWYYAFSASRNENEIQNTLNTFNLAGELTGFIKEKASLQQSVSSMNAPPGANICDIYVMNEANALLFKDKEDFTYSLGGSRENYKSGVVTVRDAVKGNVFLGLNNPDNLYGIHLAIEVIAVVKSEGEEEEIIRMPVITYYPTGG